MNRKQITDRLTAARQNMANKMVAGLNYDYEESEVVRLSAKLKELDVAT